MKKLKEQQRLAKEAKKAEPAPVVTETPKQESSKLPSLGGLPSVGARGGNF